MSMTDDLRARLEADQRIIEAATEGPWEVLKERVVTEDMDMVTPRLHSAPDAEFIAASRTRWEQTNRALLAVLEVEDEPISGDTMMGYEIHEAEGANRMLREVRRVTEEAME